MLAATMRQTGLSTLTKAACKGQVGSGGNWLRKAKKRAIKTLITPAATITVRAAGRPSSLWIISRKVKVSG